MILLAGDPELMNIRSLLTQMSKCAGHKMQSLHLQRQHFWNHDDLAMLISMAFQVGRIN